MILSHRQIEEIAVAVTKDFNVFFFGPDTEEARLLAVRRLTSLPVTISVWMCLSHRRHPMEASAG